MRFILSAEQVSRARNGLPKSVSSAILSSVTPIYADVHVHAQAAAYCTERRSLLKNLAMQQ